MSLINIWMNEIIATFLTLLGCHAARQILREFSSTGSVGENDQATICGWNAWVSNLITA